MHNFLKLPPTFIGIAASGIDQDEKDIRKFTLVGLRSLGFGKVTMQDCILIQSAQLNKKFREACGRPFNPRNFLVNAAANVISSVLLGRTFPPDDPEFDTVKRYLKTVLRTSHYNQAWLLD